MNKPKKMLLVLLMIKEVKPLTEYNKLVLNSFAFLRQGNVQCDIVMFVLNFYFLLIVFVLTYMSFSTLHV